MKYSEREGEREGEKERKKERKRRREIQSIALVFSFYILPYIYLEYAAYIASHPSSTICYTIYVLVD